MEFHKHTDQCRILGDDMVIISSETEYCVSEYNYYTSYEKKGEFEGYQVVVVKLSLEIPIFILTENRPPHSSIHPDLHPHLEVVKHYCRKFVKENLTRKIIESETFNTKDFKIPLACWSEKDLLNVLPFDKVKHLILAPVNYELFNGLEYFPNIETIEFDPSGDYLIPTVGVAGEVTFSKYSYIRNKTFVDNLIKKGYRLTELNPHLISLKKTT